MKKGKKITLIAAGCLVLLGLILAGAGMAAIGFDPNSLSSTAYHTENYEINEEICHIFIDGGSSDVHIYPSDYDTCRVVYTENVDVPLEVAVNNGDTLSIRRGTGSTWHMQFGIYLGETGISVYLPKAQYESLEIRTSSGNITVSGDLPFASATVQSASGEVILDNVNATTAIQAKSTSGDVTFTDVEGKSIAVNTTSGKITLNRAIAVEDICLQSASGEIELKNSDAAELYIQATSGDVSGTLLSEKVFRVDTISGTVDVPYSGIGGECQIITASGDIRIAVAPEKT